MLQKHLGSTVLLLTASPFSETLHHISMHLGNQAGPGVSHCRCSLASSWSGSYSISHSVCTMQPQRFPLQTQFFCVHSSLVMKTFCPHKLEHLVIFRSLKSNASTPVLDASTASPACLYVLGFTASPSPPHSHPPWLSA